MTVKRLFAQSAENLRDGKIISIAKPVSIDLSTYAKNWSHEINFKLIFCANKKACPTPLDTKITGTG